MSAAGVQREKHPLFDPRSALADAVVLTAAAAGANALFSADDPGWMQLNPSPLVLVCVLVGARHGFKAGALVGGALAALVLAARYFVLAQDPMVVFHERPYFFLAFSAAGAIAGELHRIFARNMAQQSIVVDHTTRRLRALDTEFYLLRESKDEIERMLASRDNELATLDSEIRRLHQSDDSHIYDNLLRLLSRQTRVSDAAIYSTGAKPMRRLAFVGNTSHLPAELLDGQAPMADLALKKRDIVSLPEIWDKPEAVQEGHLLAVPLLDSDQHPYALLLVAGIPFMALNKRTVRSINLICRWASEVLESRTEKGANYRQLSPTGFQRIYLQNFFRASFSLSFDTWAQFRLPCCICLVTLPDEGPETQDTLEHLVVPALRTGDIPCVLEMPAANMAVLLQLTGERGGTLFAKRILNHCSLRGGAGDRVQTRLFLVENYRKAAEFWAAIHKPDETPLLDPR